MACGIHLEGVSKVIALTTAVSRPLVHALGVELHEEDVPVALAIQVAIRRASHPGMAVLIDLQSNRSLITPTTEHTSPLMDALRIEFHEEPTVARSVGRSEVSIQAQALCVSSH